MLFRSRLKYSATDRTALYFSRPDGEFVAARRNQVAIAAYDSATDRTALYFSRPDYPHEFRLEQDYVMVAGRVRLLAGAQDYFLIGTDRALYALGESLATLADYGASGPHVADERGTLYFLTPRGLCRAFPFEPMTEPAHVPETRETVLLGLLPWSGSAYCIAHQTGETRTAPQSVPYLPKPIIAVHANGIPI